MRKLFVALLVGAVAVGLAAPAFAADLKFSGAYRVRFQFDKGLTCLSRDPVGAAPEEDCDGNRFQTRLRPRLEVETEGGVRAMWAPEIGDVTFGQGGGTNVPGGGHSADGLNVETKWAYIDFPVPATPLRLRAGIQPFFLSKALFLDDDESGLSLYGKLGDANVNAWWFRPNKAGSSSGRFTNQLAGGTRSGLAAATSGVDVGTDGEFARDIYGLEVTLSPVKDLNLNAYLVYDHDNETLTGAAAPLENTTGLWLGVGAAGKVQNIRWDADFVYGSKETPHPVATTTKVDQKGWMVDGGVGMALPGTPLDLEARGWWATGWDGSATGDIDAFPVLYGGSGGHEPGTQVWGGGGVIDINNLADNPQNTWGIGLIARYTVSPTLKITANVHYIGVPEEGGTATAGAVTRVSPVGEGFLYGVDSVGTEFGGRIDYTIARGLVFTLTAGHLLLGDDTATNGDKFDDVTKVAGVVNYGF